MYYLLFAFFLGILIASVLNLVSIGLVSRNFDWEHTSTYECGFEPFQDSRQLVGIQFYLVALLFLIFDLEVILLYPWATAIQFMGFWEYSIMLFFTSILIAGLVYEWKRGILEWH